jgi:prepilin-type N-terminal cleavage/methylation domain-containing protein
MRRRSGFTLIELLLAMSLTAMLMTAVVYAYIAGLDMQRTHARRREAGNREEATERTITALLRGAKLAEDVGDRTTFFQGIVEGSGELGCDRLTFTTVAPGVPMAARSSADDFETQQAARGPVGGVAEVSLSTAPIGDAAGKAGLFERMQRPSDGDPAQGGTESDIDSEIDQIGFQFWDGIQWVDTWDTTTGERRLPAAVKVTIVRNGQASTTGRAFIVPIPATDVDSRNPASSGGSV